MSQYSYAGPDIGVRRVSLADLMKELGDDAAIDAASSLTDTKVYQIPGQSPPRLLRVHKDGDESLGWEWFAKKAGIPAAGEPPQPEEDDGEDDERLPPAAPRTFDVPAQHLFDLNNHDELHLQRVATEISVSTNFAIYVRAKTPEQAAEVIRRFQNGERFEPETGVFFDPQSVLATMLTVLQNSENFAEAGWRFGAMAIEPVDERKKKVILNHLVAVEHAAFKTQTEDNVDRLMASMQRSPYPD